MRTNGNTILIIGGATGIGFALAEGSATEISSNPEVIKAYLGEE